MADAARAADASTTGLPNESCTRRLCIVYRRPAGWVDSVVQTVGQTGEFCHCELWFPDWVHLGRPGWRFTNFMFHNMEMNSDAWVEYTTNPDLYAVQTLWVRQSVYRAMLEWCRTRVAVTTPYNYSSIMRMVLPHCMSATADQHDTPGMRLFCSEAIVMGLRSCTKERQPELYELFRDMVACNTKPVHLAAALQDMFYEPKPVSHVVKLRALLSED